MRRRDVEDPSASASVSDDGRASRRSLRSDATSLVRSIGRSAAARRGAHRAVSRRRRAWSRPRGVSGSPSERWSARSPRTSARSSMSGLSTARPIRSLAEHLGPDVEHALAEPGARGGRPSCTTCGGRSVTRAPAAPRCRRLEVVSDRALVDDEHGPRVVRVRRIRVVDEPRVEDLVDAGDGRLPRANPFAGGWPRREDRTRPLEARAWMSPWAAHENRP